MKIPALSLHQPWASAIALGAKLIETRGWATNYRGPLLIHAARTTKSAYDEANTRSTLWRQVLNVPPAVSVGTGVRGLPYGALVARCRLVDCVATQDTESIRAAARAIGQKYSPFERQLGDYSRGRWAWLLADVEPFARPIPWQGQRRIFDVELPEVRSA